MIGISSLKKILEIGKPEITISQNIYVYTIAP